MSKLVSVPVRVVYGSGGAMDAVVWNRRRRPVASCLERWRESGEWWEDEAERQVERLLLADGAVIEISAPLVDGRFEPDPKWRLDTLFD